MDENKKAKLLLLGEDVIDYDNLYLFHIRDIQYHPRPDFHRFDEIYSFDKGKEIMQVDINLTALIEVNDYIKIHKAKKVKVVPLDEFGNIID